MVIPVTLTILSFTLDVDLVCNAICQEQTLIYVWIISHEVGSSPTLDQYACSHKNHDHIPSFKYLLFVVVYCMIRKHSFYLSPISREHESIIRPSLDDEFSPFPWIT